MVKVNLDDGVYVLAVSGGVDSVVLLDILARKALSDKSLSKLKLTVAHFDHGIREDSKSDRQLVQEIAKNYGLPFVYRKVNLGAGASEAVARKVRYDFLLQVRKAAGAQAIVTAHHQDDVIETVFLNLMRGTGRKGLSSLSSTDVIKRPLLHVPKSELVRYATDNQLVWHEDSTNLDERYLRNHVRRQIVPRMSVAQRTQLLKTIEHAQKVNQKIDKELEAQLQVQPAENKLDRQTFNILPSNVALELLATWLRRQGAAGFDSKTLHRLLQAAKNYKPGQKADVYGGLTLYIGRNDLTLHINNIPKSTS